MKKAISFRSAAAALGCTAVFFVTYYGGIFYNLKISFFVGALLTFPLLVSKSFNNWGAKTGLYFVLVLLLVGVAQAYDLNQFIAEYLRYDLDDISWGEQLMISNCLWFGIVFGSAMVSLAVTAVIAYIKQPQE